MSAPLMVREFVIQDTKAPRPISAARAFSVLGDVAQLDTLAGETRPIGIVLRVLAITCRDGITDWKVEENGREVGVAQ
jgi:hypothetical protein